MVGSLLERLFDSREGLENLICKPGKIICTGIDRLPLLRQGELQAFQIERYIVKKAAENGFRRETFRGDGTAVLDVFPQKLLGFLRIFFSKNTDTILISEQRKSSQVRVFTETFFIKDPLNGIAVQIVEGFVGIGTDTDSNIKIRRGAKFCQFSLQSCGFYGKMFVVTDGSNLFPVREQEGVADIVIAAEDFLKYRLRAILPGQLRKRKDNSRKIGIRKELLNLFGGRDQFSGRKIIKHHIPEFQNRGAKVCLLCLGLFDLGFFDGLLQLVFIDGFQNEISDLIADGFYRIVEISMAGEDGNGDIRKPFPDMLDQGEAVHNGHTDIRQDQIRREIFQKFQGLGAVGSGGDIR